jgi:hypothetical protein
MLGSPLDHKEAPPFPDALQEFLDKHGATLGPRSKYNMERSIKRHFHWQKTIDKITHNDIAGVIDGIERQSAACHALKDIRTFFNWCVPKYVAYSPCQGIRMPAKYVPRQRVLTDHEITVSNPFNRIARPMASAGSIIPPGLSSTMTARSTPRILSTNCLSSPASNDPSSAI